MKYKNVDGIFHLGDVYLALRDIYITADGKVYSDRRKWVPTLYPLTINNGMFKVDGTRWCIQRILEVCKENKKFRASTTVVDCTKCNSVSTTVPNDNAKPEEWVIGYWEGNSFVLLERTNTLEDAKELAAARASKDVPRRIFVMKNETSVVCNHVWE